MLLACTFVREHVHLPVVFLCSTFKRAGVFLLLTGGRIEPHTEGQCTPLFSTHTTMSMSHSRHAATIIADSIRSLLSLSCLCLEAFEVACEIDQDIVMHPFAFRTHAHKLGRIVFSTCRTDAMNNAIWSRSCQFGISSAWKKRWTRMDRNRSTIASITSNVLSHSIGCDHQTGRLRRCRLHDVQFAFPNCQHWVRWLVRHCLHSFFSPSSTSKDEMCNFYMMYWVDGDQLLNDDVCISRGPPEYYFRRDRVNRFISHSRTRRSTLPSLSIV